MAFINEKITDPADQERFRFWDLANPVTHEPVTPRKWTADRQRDAFLFWLGGQGAQHSEIPGYYALVWHDEVIVLETFDRGQGVPYSDEGVTIWWKIGAVFLPAALERQRKEAINLIKESLTAMDDRSEYRVKVKFDHIANPIIMRG
jgi:hypothetical protein